MRKYEVIHLHEPTITVHMKMALLVLCALVLLVAAVVVGYCAMQVRGIAWVFGLLRRLLEASAHC